MSSLSASGYPAPGARIGRFLIQEQLGQGGMGVVYRALEENLGREVALKIVAPHLAYDPEFRERFSREARAQASLESSHVVAVYAHGEEDGYLYIASQLIVDGDLGQLIKRAGVPPMVDALDVIEQVASGLSDAHEAGLVHRDIKPGNVLVRIRGNSVRAYLADFGIARRFDAAATRFSSSAVGTPSYMAPELHGGAPASVATDVYALGCLLWVALTGAPPYGGTSEYQIVGAHMSQPVPQLAGASPMERATNRILRFAMAKDPAERYRSAAAMRADLQAALRLPARPGSAVPDAGGGTALRPLTPTGTHTPGRPPTAPPPPRAGFTGPGGPAGPAGPAGPSRSSRRPWAVVLGIAAVVALVAGVAAALLLDGGDDPSDPDPTAQDTEFTEMAADAILTASEKEMKVLDSVRVRGDFVEDDGSRLQVDIVVTTGGDCEGTMEQRGGGMIEIVRSDGRVFAKPDLEFMQTSAGTDPASARLLLRALDGRYLEFTERSAKRDLTAICDLDELLERDGREDAVATNAGTVEVEGEDTVKVELTQGANWEAYYVQVAEPHYTLRLDESEDDSLYYSEFDGDHQIEMPATKDYATIDKLLSEIGG